MENKEDNFMKQFQTGKVGSSLAMDVKGLVNSFFFYVTGFE